MGITPVPDAGYAQVELRPASFSWDLNNDGTASETLVNPLPDFPVTAADGGTAKLLTGLDHVNHSFMMPRGIFEYLVFGEARSTELANGSFRYEIVAWLGAGNPVYPSDDDWTAWTTIGISNNVVLGARRKWIQFAASGNVRVPADNTVCVLLIHSERGTIQYENNRDDFPPFLPHGMAVASYGASSLPALPAAQSEAKTYKPRVASDGTVTWEESEDGQEEDGEDRNRIAIEALQHLTRDLHSEAEPGTWETADDGVLIASTPDTSGYDSTAFGSATAMVTNVAASNNNTPVSVSIRLPAGADVSQYRLINDLGLITPGNAFENRNRGVSPADSNHDYYKRVFVLGEREVSYDWTLQKLAAGVGGTHYDGEFRGTFEDDLIPLDALAPAVRMAIAAGGGDGGGDDGGIAEGLEPLEPLDGDGLSVGDVVLSGHALHQYTTPGTANAFAGVLGTYREAQTYYLLTSRSDSHFGAHGRFTDNHDAAIGAVLVGQSTNNIMEVHIDKAAYETAKGSAIASGDEISAAFTGTVSGSSTTTTHVLPYVRPFTVGAKTWLSFEGQAPNSVPKRVGTHPDGWSLIVSQGGSVLLTHGVDASHFTEYPVAGIDQTARDIIDSETTPGAIRDALQTLTDDNRLAASAIKDLPQPVPGLAGLRTESISFQEDVAESPGDELSPIAQDPIVVVHGDGDPEMLTGLSGNDFTVAPGLYFIQATGNQDGGGIGHFALQFRQSSDNAVIAAMPNIFFYNTGEQPFTASAYWHVTEAVEINLFLARFDNRAVGVADLVISFARLTAEDTADHHIIEPLEPLDVDEAKDGNVVLSEHEFYVRQPGHGTANTFAGVLERWTDGADTWLGTAIRNSVYGQRGEFSSNPDSNVGVLLAGVSTDNANTIDVWIRKAAYDAALGRAAQSGDTVKVVITGEVSGSSTTVTSTLTYAVFHGDSGYYSFSAVDAANVLRQLADGAVWSMVVNRSNDAPLLTHAAGAAHFVEYPIRSAIDQYARDEVARALSEITLSFEQSRYPRDETFTIPQVGTNGVSQFDPIILAANASGANAHLVGSFLGDVNVLGRDDALNDGIEGIALEDASSGSFRMLSWGLVNHVPLGPRYTHSQLQTQDNWPTGKPVYVTDRDNRVRPGGSTDNRKTNADLTYWTLDPDESADDLIYGYCVAWEGAAGTNQQGIYGVIFDFRRVPFPASS